MKNLKDELEIMIPTFNRCKDLKNTLQQLLDEQSPVKSISITVLDNHSDDGTQSLMQDICKNYPNIRYIRHNRNIGAIANSCRSIELATKKYLWVIDDDSNYDWENGRRFKKESRKMQILLL